MAIPDPPWKAAPRQRPARAPLSQEAILDAAMRVLDREGAAGLSMRRVADELGTGPASLYWHVPSKDALIDLVIDRVAGEVPLPEPDPARWQEQLREWMIGVRGVFERHPGVAALTLGRIPTGVNVVRWAEWTLVLLRGAGLPDRVAAYAGDLLGLYLGATGYEAALPPMTSADRRGDVARGDHGHGPRLLRLPARRPVPQRDRDPRRAVQRRAGGAVRAGP